MADLAVEQDYLDWNGLTTVPANLPAPLPVLLREASRMVRRASITGIYNVADDGTPSDQTVIDAFRDATCAQVSGWVALKVNPLAGGVDQSRVIMNKSLDGASISYANAQSQAAEAADAARYLVPAAVQILRDANLIRSPLVYG